MLAPLLTHTAQQHTKSIGSSNLSSSVDIYFDTHRIYNIFPKLARYTHLKRNKLIGFKIKTFPSRRKISDREERWLKGNRQDKSIYLIISTITEHDRNRLVKYVYRNLVFISPQIFFVSHLNCVLSI